MYTRNEIHKPIILSENIMSSNYEAERNLMPMSKITSIICSGHNQPSYNKTTFSNDKTLMLVNDKFTFDCYERS